MRRLQRDNQIGPQKHVEPADWIIAAGLAVPLIFDLIAWRKGWKTASVRFGEFLTDPKTRSIFVLFWIGLTLHLFVKLPLPFQSTIKRIVTKEKNK